MSLLKVAGTTASSGTLYVNDVFSTYLYTGNGSTQTITNGIDLAGKGGLVWTKDRVSATNTHKLTDTARGYQYAIQSSDTNAQEDNGTAGISSFGTTGYGIGSDWRWNKSADTYVSWTFRKAAKFFDVVTWTGDGVTNGGTNPLTGTTYARSITHSLGIAPGMIIVKCTSAGTTNWKVWHRSVIAGATLLALNSTEASQGTASLSGGYASAYNPSPENTFYLYNYYSGGVAEVNASGATYVAYLFAHDTSSTGIIQCGSFTADGAGNASVNLGWEPQYLMFKITDSANNWYINDTMRNSSLTGYGVLYANLANAEATGTGTTYLAPNATGFTCSNTPAGNYIYMAIRRPNKPPTSGTQVFSPQVATQNLSNNTLPSAGFPIDTSIMLARDGSFGFDMLVDRLRGKGGGRLLTNDTGAELWTTYFNFDAQTNLYITGALESTSHPFVFWNFKRAPGFFDEVCYTGTGVATTQAHNLGVAPELMIVKCRSTVTDWGVYNSDLGNTKYLWLDSTNSASVASSYWNNTSPTPTNFSVKDNSQTNTSGATYVAYLFATLAGISKVGSYTGNGGTQNIECGFAAGARFFLVKATSTTGSWWVWDSARGITSGNDPALQLNSTAAEITTADAVDPYSPGITVNQEATCSINASGVSYIFLAVA